MGAGAAGMASVRRGWDCPVLGTADPQAEIPLRPWRDPDGAGISLQPLERSWWNRYFPAAPGEILHLLQPMERIMLEQVYPEGLQPLGRR